MPTLTIIPRSLIVSVAEALPDSKCAELIRLEKELGKDCIFYKTELGLMMIPKEREREI
jgi:hypothetical protein